VCALVGHPGPGLSALPRKFPTTASDCGCWPAVTGTAKIQGRRRAPPRSHFEARRAERSLCFRPADGAATLVSGPGQSVCWRSAWRVAGRSASQFSRPGPWTLRSSDGSVLLREPAQDTAWHSRPASGGQRLLGFPIAGSGPAGHGSLRGPDRLLRTADGLNSGDQSLWSAIWMSVVGSGNASCLVDQASGQAVAGALRPGDMADLPPPWHLGGHTAGRLPGLGFGQDAHGRSGSGAPWVLLATRGIVEALRGQSQITVEADGHFCAA